VAIASASATAARSTLGAIDIIRLYGLRFKIEHCFKQAIRLIGSFAYHFWMRGMVPLRHPNRNQYVHRQPVPTGRIPSSSQAQGRRPPRLHPSWSGRPRSAPISRGRCPQAGMGLVRILAANHSSRHPAFRNSRCPGVAQTLLGFLRSCLGIPTNFTQSGVDGRDCHSTENSCNRKGEQRVLSSDAHGCCLGVVTRGWRAAGV
jgi:hypothetical protein